ncbi:hypothetical protein D3C85_1875770 [compost metagenome]
MVILQKAPHLAQRGQVLHLDRRQAVKRDARAIVEFVIVLERGLGRLLRMGEPRSEKQQ